MSQTKEKILSRVEGLKKITAWKDQGKEVVFTNGCFDILHLGHVDYLEKAREKGDRLILGLNSDDSVSRLKGESRPINKVEARARLLAALQFVDAVVTFEEDTPLELISYLKPDILVKGKDYEISNIVGADVVIENGGKVETIDLVDGFSTTGIINKINE